MIFDDLTREEYRLILESLFDGILVITNDGSIAFCNQALSKMYGSSCAELAEMDSDEFFSLNYIDQSFIKLARETRQPITFAQTTRSKREVLNTLIPVSDDNGGIRFIVEHSRDYDSLEFNSPKEFSVTRARSKSYDGESAVSGGKPLFEFSDPAMQRVYAIAGNVATKDVNLLILGASGTGKSLLAKRIHAASDRRKGPFVTIDCATIPPNLIESELFGYVKGAFTSASASGKQGLVEQADGGTLFLDEIGELPTALQGKLLKLVQDKEFLPVGGTRTKQADIRIIAASNKNIPDLISKGEFRDDLYYRLAVVTIKMPDLVERGEDLPRLLRHFTDVNNLKYDTNIAFSNDARDILLRYPWPGNIREMEHIVELLILTCRGDVITPDMLPSNILNAAGAKRGLTDAQNTSVPDAAPVSECANDEYGDIESLDEFIEAQEAALIRALYKEYNTSYKLAERLRISQSRASRLMRKYNIK